MSIKSRNFFLFVAETMVIVAVTLFAVLPVSCKLTESGIHILDGDYDFPKLVSFVVEDENKLSLSFSEKVDFVSQVVSSNQKLKIESNLCVQENRKDWKVVLSESMEVGSSYELLGTVKDEFGNSLTFALPFWGFNPNVPELMMTEIQTESVSSRNKTEKEKDLYRNEYVMFVALSDGNLCGLELVSAYDGEERKYSFPNVNVHKGETFVVHLRNRGNGCTSELEDNLKLSQSSYCSDTVRDLWTDDTQTALGNKTDVIVLRNSANGKLLDCFIYRESKVTEWTGTYKEMYNLVCENNLLLENENESVYESDGKTNSKVYKRINTNSIVQEFMNNENCEYPVKMNAKDWCIDSATAGTL